MRPNGPVIRAIRNARNLSIRNLQTETGLHRGYLSRLERGEISEASDERVRRVATALNVPPDVITHEETSRDREGHEDAPHEHPPVDD